MNQSPDSRPQVSSTSLSLLRKIRAQDPEAWERLVDLYGIQVFAWCRRAGLKPQDAADVMQDVFLAVHTAIDRFQKDDTEGTFRGWLWTITQNKVRDFFRKQQRNAQVIGGSGAQSMFEGIPELLSEESVSIGASRSNSDRFQQALELVRNEFEDRTWQAFWRAVIEQHRTADIAADLGVTPNAVRQSKSRVLRRLRDELGQLES